MLTAARESPNTYDFALVCLLGLLGLRIFETVGADIEDLGEEHGHRVMQVQGKGGKLVLVPLPPAVSRAVDRAAGDRPFPEPHIRRLLGPDPLPHRRLGFARARAQPRGLDRPPALER